MNGLGNEGAFGVAEILKLSGTVTYLDVSRNRIGKTGAVVIGKALEGNELLQTLKVNVQFSKITEKINLRDCERPPNIKRT
jgi:hypothetical protein